MNVSEMLNVVLLYHAFSVAGGMRPIATTFKKQLAS